ncbi:L,D-transpeptidase [Prosthecobacter sp.]|jgi:hypothetical protein|uniref:L,D-transpeptidase n=1 Tax=Prosthecobacter sp. TaxID=1965333 RepID=UPI0025F138E4|nr:L,D-transpeptidase [Prosthecobacter sp.]
MLFFDWTPESRACTRLLKVAVAVMLAGSLCQCTSSKPKGDVVVSVKDQKLGIYGTDGKLAKKYVISTSKFGLGDQRGSNRTPLGTHEIVAKIGHGLPAGAVLKSRRWNGEVLKPNAPGRDPIVSRILWLKGTEKTNQNAFNRFIYIHGTPEENRLGQPASYGCVRMGMKDVVDLFNTVDVGAKVVITKDHLPRGAPDKADDGSPATVAPDASASGQPIEIARILPSEGEKKRAEENAAKSKTSDKAGPEKPAPASRKTKADAKVAGKTSSRTKGRA